MDREQSINAIARGARTKGNTWHHTAAREPQSAPRAVEPTWLELHASAPIPAQRNPLACSCGCTEPHEIAKRETCDGVAVVVWSDGMITWRYGMHIRGIGQARDNWGIRCDQAAAELISDWVNVIDAAELPRAIRAARKVARKARREGSWEHMSHQQRARWMFGEMSRAA